MSEIQTLPICGFYYGSILLFTKCFITISSIINHKFVDFQLIISGNKIFFNYMDNECWMMKALWCLIYCIGCYHLAKFVFALGWSLVRWMTRKVDVRKKYGGEGCWAVVTGGTDGIGLGFVEVLVEDGWNVCIISRNE